MIALPIAIIAAIVDIYKTHKKNIEDYENSSYYKCTKIPYNRRKISLGKYGEYLTYCNLNKFEKTGAKLLFNLYIPKENGETTEIDALMICSKGIYVFESKNFSGWIFGSENKKYWYQTLAAGRNGVHKESFYNPIMQNTAHINHLRKFIGKEIPMRSIILFSDRCTLKNISVKSNDVYVINRYKVSGIITQDCENIKNDILDENMIIEIYDKLFHYTQVESTVKTQHIANIQNNVITTNQKTFQRIKCPVCDGYLVERKVKDGWNVGEKFYGCSNYPKCRYTRNL